LVIVGSIGGELVGLYFRKQVEELVVFGRDGACQVGDFLLLIGGYQKLYWRFGDREYIGGFFTGSSYCHGSVDVVG
jgi:hypothetical protein